MSADYDIAILGAGFGGLGLGHALKRAGRDSFVILEQADRIGGTWRDNTYPGAGCDVESHLYCYSFAKKRDWPRVFSRQTDILAYIEAMADRGGLWPHLRLGQEVTEARWDDRAARWQVRTRAGDRYAARVFVAAWGQLNRPQLPDIPGRDDFAGTAFHSARWRHDVDLSGRRVACIGNGATAAQFVPEIAPDVRSLAVFQRSPNWIVPRLDRAYAADELRRFRADPATFEASRRAIFEEREARFARMRVGSGTAEETTRIARDHLASQVPDPALRAALTPDYPIGCKRIIVSDDYYPALMRENVRLVTAVIARIERDGIRTRDGALHPADVLVYATGFETHSFQGPVEIFGRGGRPLRAAWADAPEAYLGLAVAGFPNFFMLYGPNTNLGHNSILLMLEAQIGYILQALGLLDEVAGIDVRADAMARFNAELQDAFLGTSWVGGCTSWYVRADGRVINNWSGTVREYQARTARLDRHAYARLA